MYIKFGRVCYKESNCFMCSLTFDILVCYLEMPFVVTITACSQCKTIFSFSIKVQTRKIFAKFLPKNIFYFSACNCCTYPYVNILSLLIIGFKEIFNWKLGL